MSKAGTKKMDGQKELVKGMSPELKDDETAAKLDTIHKLHEQAKLYEAARSEVSETVKGFVLGLSPADQAVGKVRIGDYVVPFSIADTKETPVSFKRKAGKKVTLKLTLEETEDE